MFESLPCYTQCRAVVQALSRFHKRKCCFTGNYETWFLSIRWISRYFSYLWAPAIAMSIIRILCRAISSSTLFSSYTSCCYCSTTSLLSDLHTSQCFMNWDFTLHAVIHVQVSLLQVKVPLFYFMTGHKYILHATKTKITVSFPI